MWAIFLDYRTTREGKAVILVDEMQIKLRDLQVMWARNELQQDWHHRLCALLGLRGDPIQHQ